MMSIFNGQIDGARELAFGAGGTNDPAGRL